MKIKIVYVNIENKETVLTLEENIPYLSLVPMGALLTIDDKEYSIADVSQVIRTDNLETTITIDLKPEFVEQQFTEDDFPVIDTQILIRQDFGFDKLDVSYFNIISKLYKFVKYSEQPSITEQDYQEVVQRFVCNLPYKFRMEQNMPPYAVPEFFNPYAMEKFVTFFNEKIQLGNINKVKSK